MGPYITPVISTLKTAGPTVTAWFGWANVFLKTNLGISRLSNKVAPAIKYMGELVEQIIKHPKVQSAKQAVMPTSKQAGVVSPLGKGGYMAAKIVASLVPPTISAKLRTAGALAAKVNPAIWGKLGSASVADVALFAGQTLENSVFKTIQKVVEEEFRDKPVSLVLQYVDKTFGTAYSDAYLAYLGGKKMWKYQDGKFISIVDNIANALKPDVNNPFSLNNPFDYSNKQADKIKAIGANQDGSNFSTGIMSKLLQMK
jgi:hypothetical protein